MSPGHPSLLRTLDSGQTKQRRWKSSQPARSRTTGSRWDTSLSQTRAHRPSYCPSICLLHTDIVPTIHIRQGNSDAATRYNYLLDTSTSCPPEGCWHRYATCAHAGRRMPGRLLFRNNVIPPGAPRPKLPWAYTYAQFDQLLQAYPDVHRETL